MTTAPSALRFTRTTAATETEAATYSYGEGRYRIAATRSRTKSARLGSYVATNWRAIDLMAPGGPAVASSGTTMASLKRRFGRYLADREAGCTMHPEMYCRG